MRKELFIALEVQISACWFKRLDHNSIKFFIHMTVTVNTVIFSDGV